MPPTSGDPSAILIVPGDTICDPITRSIILPFPRIIEPTGAVVLGVSETFAADKFVVSGGGIIVPELEYMAPDWGGFT